MMLRRCLALIGSLAITLSFAPRLRADATADARKAIQDSYNKMDAAVLAGDSKTLFSFFSPDRIESDIHGKKTLAEVKEAYAWQLPKFKSINALDKKIVNVIKGFKLIGNEAIVRATGSVDVTVLNPQTHKRSVLSSITIEEDVWTKKSGTWLQKSSHFTSVTHKVDGHPNKPFVVP